MLNTFSRQLTAAAAICCAFAAMVLLSGCSTKPLHTWEVITGPDHTLLNVHRLAPKLPSRIRRVAVIPLTTAPGDGDLEHGRETLEPLLQSELDRLPHFEVIRVTREQMRQWTGQREWSSLDKLPLDFLKVLKEEPGCDAVLFSRLTRYFAYPPMAIGWSFKLVDTTDGNVWWAADELFDLSEPNVVNSARRHELKHQRHYQATPHLADSRSVLISPRRFASYTLHTLFATLPER